MLNKESAVALRMERQHFYTPVSAAEYDALFRDISPVPTIGWCEPGLPPTLPPHAGFDDGIYNAERRRGRKILKGRFGGGVAYVDAADLELYACLYCKPLPRLTLEQGRMLDLLRREGPLNIGSIKEITGLLVKQITPILHRLQEAFLVFEDQAYSDGDRGWYPFDSEFPAVNPGRMTKTEALEAVLPRFAYRQVFFTSAMAKDFYRQPLREVTAALEKLVSDGILAAAELEGTAGYLRPADAALLDAVSPAPRGILAVQRNDFLVKSLAGELKERFSSPYETLYYLLIDGELRGAVCGRFKFGPHIIEDVLLDLPSGEQESRREEVLDAVYTVFDRTASPLKRYAGQGL